MKKLLFLFSILLVSTFWQVNANDEKQLQKDEDSHYEDLLAREEWFYRQRAFPFERIEPEMRTRALKYVKEKLRPEMTQRKINPQVDGTFWIPVGPDSIPNGQLFPNGRSGPVSGRVSAAAIDPKNPNTIYIGAAMGGVWKTTDGGSSWSPLTDFQPSLATGSIVIDPKDSNIIYIGTGEGNLSLDNYFGAGILKSTDAGVTFSQFAEKSFQGVSIADLAIDPDNTNILYAGVTFGRAGVNGGLATTLSPRGVYKSTDSGRSWNQLSAPTGDVTDIEMHPTNRQIIFAAYNSFGNSNQVGGLYRTTDSGATWSLVGGNGFPTTMMGRISFGLAPSAPNIIYAAIEERDPNRNLGDLKGLFKSIDGGANWIATTRPPAGGFGNICQCFYDNEITISPTDPNILFFGGVPLYLSRDGGATWSNASDLGGLHADVHAIEFDPSNPRRVVVGNDGGVWLTEDLGTSWKNINANLAITQFQYVDIHPSNADFVIGGTQDNGTMIRQSNNNTWTHSRGGDGGAVLVDFKNPNTLYHTFFRVSFERSENGGLGWFGRTRGLITSDRSLFYAPVAMNPVDPQILYFGTFRLYRTTDRGDFWSPISSDLTQGQGSISAIAIANNQTTIYVGTSDGNLQTSTNNGTTFTNSTIGLPVRYITRIAVEPADPKIVYLTVSGFDTGHVFKSTDGGLSWKDISGNLPNIPTNAIVVDSSVANKLYVGTDIGVFVTTDGGVTWSEVAQGLPNSAVFDLKINNQTNTLVAATHGRGVFKLSNVATPKPTITGASFQKPNLTITGSGFSTSGAVVSINGSNITNLLISQNDSTIVLKGNKKRLKLNKGQNQVSVIVAGVSSNTFLFNF